jgi:hypothetical protein
MPATNLAISHHMTSRLPDLHCFATLPMAVPRSRCFLIFSRLLHLKSRTRTANCSVWRSGETRQGRFHPAAVKVGAGVNRQQPAVIIRSAVSVENRLFVCPSSCCKAGVGIRWMINSFVNSCSSWVHYMTSAPI